MVDTLRWFNVGLALFASLAAFSALTKANWRTTRPCIGAALFLLAAGLGAQWLGELRHDWMRLADTATFAGILVLLIATQHVPSWFLERWKNPVASVIAGVVIVLWLVVLLTTPAHAADVAPEPAPATIPLSPENAQRCQAEGGCVLVTKLFLAYLVQSVSEAREQADAHDVARAAAERRCPRPGGAASAAARGR